MGTTYPATQHNNPEGLNPQAWTRCSWNSKILCYTEIFKINKTHKTRLSFKTVHFHVVCQLQLQQMFYSHCRDSLLSGCTRRSLAESDDTRGCICTICVAELLMMGGMRSKHVEPTWNNKLIYIVHLVGYFHSCITMLGFMNIKIVQTCSGKSHKDELAATGVVCLEFFLSICF